MGLKNSIDVLRTEQKPSFNRSLDETKKLPKNYTPSAK